MDLGGRDVERRKELEAEGSYVSVCFVLFQSLVMWESGLQHAFSMSSCLRQHCTPDDRKPFL